MSTTIQAADPASKTIFTFNDVGALHNAIKMYQYIPIRPDGSPYVTQYLQEYDGYILDGAPLNVWMDGVWLEGQKEALQPYWDAGTIQRPAANLLNAGAVPMPPEVAERTAAAKAAATGGGIFGMDTSTLIALGGGLVLLWLISSSPHKGSRESSYGLD